MKSITSLIITLFLLQLTIHTTYAIGGWETIHILMNRLSPKEDKNKASSRREPGSRVAPIVPNGGSSSSSGGNTADNKKEEGERSSKRHVGEVTMTSSSSSSSSPSSSSGAVDASVAVASSGGRRGNLLHLDENDLKTITFVGRSNPFL